MAEVIWTSPLDDLDDLAEYIALSNTQAAKLLTQKVFDKISGLESHPESGKRPRELINLNYRELNVNPCRIFYKVDSDKVYILHVMRQERELLIFLLQS
ncbi:type II toxin-antitoxin system RelE/ParE family toxin [Colwellia sp. MSW7]|uniref:Type II toxin-antitoxin system RelE/ParE family toxin n=1 Tax=Colwellia maritima TaxID=2912588 RepID=A0ABS9X3T0_9GAMM|nr:type II toxin-antitoxin system RelE/ParE family toxin [Colwellia maritima]MCI2284126.1 type II toxin-antitoxin system RelE/ParE family toxin [Colwellia maritima]